MTSCSRPTPWTIPTSTTRSTAASPRRRSTRLAQGFGNTPAEEAAGETLEQRVAQEEPEPDPYVQAEERSEAMAADEDDDHEVGDARAGRIVEPDEGAHEDTESGLVGTDVGIDGAAASAEEAAMHVIPDDPDREE